MEAQAQERKQARKPIKEGEIQLRPGEWMGRNGEVLVRIKPKTGNPLDFPDDVKEPGWSYQWIRHSVYNNTDFSEMGVMKRAGWREVHPDSLKGYFKDQVKAGQGHIEVEGLTLMERPEGMTKEAQAEEARVANDQYGRVATRIFDPEALLPSGFVAHLNEVSREEYQPSPREWAPKLNPRKNQEMDE